MLHARRSFSYGHIGLCCYAIMDLGVGNQLQGYKLEVAAGAVLSRMIDRGMVIEQDQGKNPKYVLRLPERA